MRLAAAVENVSLERLRAQRGWTGNDVDIQPALVAIIEFAVNRQIVNEAIGQLEDIRDLWFNKTEDIS